MSAEKFRSVDFNNIAVHLHVCIIYIPQVLEFYNSWKQYRIYEIFKVAVFIFAFVFTIAFIQRKRGNSFPDIFSSFNCFFFSISSTLLHALFLILSLFCFLKMFNMYVYSSTRSYKYLSSNPFLFFIMFTYNVNMFYSRR